MALDYTHRGDRVQIRPGDIRNTNHVFRGDERGTLLAECDNGLGRLLASVEWDGGDFGPVFSEDLLPLGKERT